MTLPTRLIFRVYSINGKAQTFLAFTDVTSHVQKGKMSLSFLVLLVLSNFGGAFDSLVAD